MKIYEKIVIDISSGNVVESSAFDYVGPIAELGSKPKIPGPTAAEQARQQAEADNLRTQTEILKEQVRQQELLSPFLFREAGVIPVTDESGKVIAFEEIDDPSRELRKEIEFDFLKRTQAAQRGELPLDPTLLRELDEQQEVLNERLRRQLGSGFATSTPGREALSDFGKTRAELLSSAARGDLTLAEQLGIARQGANAARAGDFINRNLGINAAPLPFASQFGDVARSFGASAQRLQQGRLARANLQQQNSTNFGGIFQGLGSLFGTALTAPVGGSIPGVSGGSVFGNIFR